MIEIPIRPENRGLYPKDWKSISTSVRERAENLCEFCGVKNGELVERFSEEKGMSIGHRAEGGGAAIHNSPLNVNIHFHFYGKHLEVSENAIERVVASIKAAIGERLGDTQKSLQISEPDIQWSFVRRIQDR